MVSEITAKSVLRKSRKVDSWFLARYGMNLYRGCAHNCAYCDGRAEGYYVEGEFGVDVAVKVNAIDILNRELDPSRRRVPLKGGYVLLGGGVGDSYQPLESRYCLARRALELLLGRRWPVHILTKSTLVERDLDLIRAIHRQRRAVVSVSFSTVDDRIARQFEPGVPAPSARLAMLSRFVAAGVPCGMFLMPVIPYVSDAPAQIGQCVAAAKAAGVEFVVFGGMTLKEGRQKEHFMRVLGDYAPGRQTEYDVIYRGDKWGQADPMYHGSLNEVFAAIVSRHQIAPRMPPRLYSDLLDENDRVVAMLEQVDYLLRLHGAARTPYGFAAYSLSQVDGPLSERRASLAEVKGVGPAVLRVVNEILDKGSSSLLTALLAGQRHADPPG